jgi:hypothetical protein
MGLTTGLPDQQEFIRVYIIQQMESGDDYERKAVCGYHEKW